ncbi:MAG: MotA/TolQ/ExbB proton channel family protein [Magnetococcales bacterium]|nr:MotA/TolQ/ExbB proton channel family protein [Magnetococcales bacterium]
MAWWIHADGVVRSIFVILIALSVAGWAIIIYKSGQLNRLLLGERRFRQALERKERVRTEATLLGAVVRFHSGGSHCDALVGQAVREQRVELESGLTFLASIGVSTPFVGLLGTVWGIMHALAGLGQHASLSLDLVAGPVAEALVATASGLFAAIPAAVGYNLLIRRLRRLMTLAEGNLLRFLADGDGGHS